MKIRYIGHSCFLFCESTGITLLTDPYGDVGLSFPRVSSDIVTVSHGHYDHCNVSAVRGEPEVFASEGKFISHGIGIDGVGAFHDGDGGRKRGKNVIFSFVMDGIRVCHLGDLGQKPEPELLKKIGRPDVLLIPVGGHYTIDGSEAARYVDLISPRVVIPMHYAVKGLTVDISDASKFLKEAGKPYRTESSLEFFPEKLPKETQIIVMERS